MTETCCRCSTPTLPSDKGICPPCTRFIHTRTQARLRKKPSVVRMAKAKGPSRYLTPYTPGVIRAQRWFASNTADLAAVNASPTIRGRCTKYGMTVGEWMVRVADQKSTCAICGLAMPALQLFIDHDHETNKVRGLLCVMCNTGLGMFKIDGPMSLARAQAVVDYIRRQR